VDLSVKEPISNSEITYSRLFGKGKHNIYQFTNDELEGIHMRAKETGSKKIFLSYHGTRMYMDALRSQIRLRSGKFISATPFTGANSAKSVLAEDAIFPSSRNNLIKKQGWKVIDVNQNLTAHLSQYLNQIPDKIYPSLNEVVKELETLF
jgi:hypothetical protein